MEIEKYRFTAHRGLYNNREGVPENSILAFEKAIEKGYAIELDVNMTEDEVLVVFHDNSLKRMTGINEDITTLMLSDIKRVKLLGTDQKIPTFEDVLLCVAGRVPLIIEVKKNENYKLLMKKLMNELSKYNGDYIIESFDPRIVYWLKKNYPDVIRGQLSAVNITDVKSKFLRKKLAKMWFNKYTKPNFVAYQHSKIDKKFYEKYSKKKIFVVAWTVNEKYEYEKVKENADIIIFENEEILKDEN